jgi:hypothetical protein
MQPEQEAGNIWLPHPDIDPDIETFINEVTVFPRGANDDETDAMTQAINWYRMRGASIGLFNYYRKEYQRQKDEAEERARAAAEGRAAETSGALPPNSLERAKAIMGMRR